jgi:hypothetical protein
MINEFQIGTQSDSTPVYYTPSKNPNMAESVLIYGDNEQLKTDIITKIIKHGIGSEKMIWIVFGQNIGGYVYNLDEYKIPISFANGKVLKEYFGWREMGESDLDEQNQDITISEYDVYTLAYDKYYKDGLNKEQFVEYITTKCEQYEMSLSNLMPAIEMLSFSRYSKFGNKLKQHIENKKPTVFSFPYLDAENYIKTISILNEIRTVTKYTRVQEYDIHIGIVFDHAEQTSTSILMRSTIHDMLLSWGRTYKTSRFIIQRGEIQMPELLNDEIDQTKDGVYSMIFQAKKDGFDYLNRINSSKKTGEYDYWENCVVVT